MAIRELPLAVPQVRERSITPLLLSALKHVTLLTLGVTFLLPFWWMVGTSLKPDQAMFVIPPLLVPMQNPDLWNELVWANYPRSFTFTRPPFTVFIGNTIVIAALSVLGALISNPLAAYGLSRIRWPGRELLFGITLSTLFLPVFVTLIPLFLIYRTFGWIGTPLPLIVPTFFGTPFYIFLLRQFMLTLPTELDDAARIDGANPLDIYWRIILPLTTPGLATVGIFSFVYHWNDFFGPLIYLTTPEKMTIAVGLQLFRGQWGTDFSLLMAASTAAVLPIITLFFFAQKTFIQGIALTGMKG